MVAELGPKAGVPASLLSPQPASQAASLSDVVGGLKCVNMLNRKKASSVALIDGLPFGARES